MYVAALGLMIPRVANQCGETASEQVLLLRRALVNHSDPSVFSGNLVVAHPP